MREEKFLLKTQTSKGLDVTLRYPLRSDLPTLWEFINTLSEERTFILFQGEKISLEDEEKYLDNVLREIELHKRCQVMAFVEDTLAGNAEITLGSGVSGHIGGLGIAIAAPFRGKGIGELLIRAVIDEAVAQLPGIKMVTLMVFGNNEVGQNLYRKVGFTEYGRLPLGILHRSQYVDMVHMVKAVSASGS